MRRSARRCFSEGSYVYATEAAEIARRSGIEPVARLASNENPFPPPPAVLDAAMLALRGVNRYPPEVPRSLLDALKRNHGEYHFAAGAGMDGVIETILRVLVDPGERVVVATPTFSFYGVAARGQGAEVVSVRREKDFSVNPEEFARVMEDAPLGFICSPNNPTGNATPPDEIAGLLESFDGVLFLDNAYVDFSDLDYRPLVKEYDNLVIGRTLSKIHGLVGLRIGYAFLPGWLEEPYRRAQTPFAVSSVAAAAAEAALGEGERSGAYLDHVRTWRDRFSREIAHRVFPSEANFVLVDVAPGTSDEATRALASRGVVVRSCRSFPDLEDHYIRVSIGEDWENERLISEINRL
ncbi:MAG TPA: aminotransferase class I/II-fold pyridoxal phosphate-dependent enzyme [Methanomicrobiales archaeon]|nr:aminotransferase class I/II-fold pyridoxal phosphate-dependent enzyme [Methanomicrobiales archaeon]